MIDAAIESVAPGSLLPQFSSHLHDTKSTILSSCKILKDSAIFNKHKRPLYHEEKRRSKSGPNNMLTSSLVCIIVCIHEGINCSLIHAGLGINRNLRFTENVFVLGI